MLKRSHLSLFSLLVVCCWLLFGCAINSQPSATLYDLGPVSSAQTNKVFPPDMPLLVISRVNAPSWLRNTMMYYRQAQVNDQQTLFYTLSRWSMPPPELFRDHLESRIVAAGGVIEGTRANKAGQLRLIVHIEDFSQYFQDDSTSEGRIALRVSIFGKDRLVAQKSFFHKVPAPSPDAPGGVQALSVAADEVITEILHWIVENRQAG
ncbi:MAG: PqiC family protein [Betaproteobacteria bacterium]|nr:PqiC family protein [Betaproteobacteria bacterium]